MATTETFNPLQVESVSPWGNPIRTSGDVECLRCKRLTWLIGLDLIDMVTDFLYWSENRSYSRVKQGTVQNFSNHFIITAVVSMVLNSMWQGAQIYSLLEQSHFCTKVLELRGLLRSTESNLTSNPLAFY